LSFQFSMWRVIAQQSFFSPRPDKQKKVVARA
jgi:hypothetical protein